LIIREPIFGSFAQDGTSPQVSGESRRLTLRSSFETRSSTAGTATVGATL
jgi:hypothetical protein